MIWTLHRIQPSIVGLQHLETKPKFYQCLPRCLLWACSAGCLIWPSIPVIEFSCNSRTLFDGLIVIPQLDLLLASIQRVETGSWYPHGSLLLYQFRPRLVLHRYLGTQTMRLHRDFWFSLDNVCLMVVYSSVHTVLYITFLLDISMWCKSWRLVSI